MRKYLICYYKEQNDTCTDLEAIVEAVDISAALNEFRLKYTYKRITVISELININFIS